VTGASHQELLRVPFGDTDGAGVVFYPNYYRWFDRMTHELFRAVGHPLLEEARSRQGPVLAETHCRYFLPVLYDDEITLSVSVSDIGRRSFQLTHRVERGEVVTTEGYEARVWVELVDGSANPINLPDDIRSALQGRPTR
jgi:acyl-CoA thioester hydrolase